jgi:DNA-binding SARP family transcriptional activator/tetratricopeptide (TPR) repeat protein
MTTRVTLLGGFGVTVDDTPVPAAEWRRRHAAGLVKLLALEPGRSLHREQIIDRMWPDLTVDEAAPRLHKAAHYARRAVGAGSMVLSGEIVSLLPGTDVEVDAVAFESAARRAISDGDRAAASAAADRYTGDLLPQDRYEPWALDARDRLRGMYLDVLRLAGRWDELVAADPTDERAHLEIVAGFARHGDPHGALRQFERLERALRQELGVAPSRTAQQVRARISAALTHQAPRQFVGRRAVRDRIDGVLGTVAQGRGQVLLVQGPPGVGKTALLAWIEDQAGRLGMRVGGGVAAQVPGAWPYAPVLESLAELSRRHPALLDALDDALREEIELGLTGRRSDPSTATGHQRLFVATAELVRLAAGGAGLVLVIDDAHAADESSLGLLHYLARGSVAERVLLVLAHRPDPPPALAHVRQSLLSRGAAITIDLDALGRDEAVDLIRLHAPVEPDVAEAIWITSGGLPFRMVEMARAAADGRPLPPDSWIPVSVTGSDRAQLAAAAILGATFDTDEFLAMTGLADDEGYPVLDRAVADRILNRTDLGYAFRHALIRDALLNAVSASHGRELHRRAADALQALNRSPARIGHHLVQGGDTAAAVPWMLRAAETEAALGAYRDGLLSVDSVLPAAIGRDRVRLLALRADLLMASGDADAAAAFRAALAIAQEPGEVSRLRSRLARVATFAGDLATAEIALDGVELTGSPDDAEILLARGHLALIKGDLAAAESAASEARRRVGLGHAPQWQLFDLVTLQGLLAHSRGEWFEKLRQELRLGVHRPALASRIFDSHLCVAEYLLYGPTPYEEVMELAGTLRDTAERSGVLRAVAFATALRGEAAYLMGDLELAAVELGEAVELHRDIGSVAGESHSLQRLAEVRLESGNRMEANRLLHRALPLARLSGNALHLVQRVYGTMIDAAPDRQAARALVDRAYAAVGVNDRCEFCSIMLAVPSAKACADVGDLENARRHLAAAQQSAQRWEGTCWQAALLEVRSHIAAAEGDVVAGRGLLRQAAELFEVSGQPLHARRCRS